VTSAASEGALEKELTAEPAAALGDELTLTSEFTFRPSLESEFGMTFEFASLVKL
jgi:hypothetical protein